MDPWAGSHAVEELTDKIANEAWALIEEIQQAGGMTKAIEQGLPKMKIEQAAAIKQGRIDSNQELIIGLNSYQNASDEGIDILEVDNKVVREHQIAQLQALKEKRDTKQVEKALERLRKAAEDSDQNLLELAVDAARLRASLGEISDALESVFKRHQAQTQTISGVYAKSVGMDKNFEKAQKLSDKFAELEGRRPRIMIAKLGQDGHDRGAKVVASGYADIGFDVDMGPLFQTPEEAAKQAVENDVHIVGISSLAAGHKTLVPELIAALDKFGRSDILVIVGGVIPPGDYDYLLEAGAVGIFGPGTKISQAAIEMLEPMIKVLEA